jgi:hypothetical protein
MDSQENGRQEVPREFLEEQQLLKLLEGILNGQDEGSQKRKRLVSYCRSRGFEESIMWAKLALYRQQGPAEVPFFIEHVSLFGYKQQKLRQRILELIGKQPRESLGDFRELLCFRKYFLERLEYVSELLVYFFLEREKGLWRESQDSSVYTNYFNHKLFSEFNAINEIIADSAGLKKLRSEYESRLLEQELDEDVPL